jgi:hypothetical protein
MMIVAVLPSCFLCCVVLCCAVQAMSWWHHYQHQSMMEQALVYWMAPFAGALMGGLLYRWVWGGGGAAGWPGAGGVGWWGGRGSWVKGAGVHGRSALQCVVSY